MSANQKSEDFRIEDWAIPEAELPWNAPTAARFQSPNVIDLENTGGKGGIHLIRIDAGPVCGSHFWERVPIDEARTSPRPSPAFRGRVGGSSLVP